jgi:hypothetical protein
VPLPQVGLLVLLLPRLPTGVLRSLLLLSVVVSLRRLRLPLPWLPLRLLMRLLLLPRRFLRLPSRFLLPLWRFLLRLLRLPMRFLLLQRRFPLRLLMRFPRKEARKTWLICLNNSFRIQYWMRRPARMLPRHFLIGNGSPRVNCHPIFAALGLRANPLCPERPLKPFVPKPLLPWFLRLPRLLRSYVSPLCPERTSLLFALPRCANRVGCASLLRT